MGCPLRNMTRVLPHPHSATSLSVARRQVINAYPERRKVAAAPHCLQSRSRVNVVRCKVVDFDSDRQLVQVLPESDAEMIDVFGFVQNMRMALSTLTAWRPREAWSALALRSDGGAGTLKFDNTPTYLDSGASHQQFPASKRKGPSHHIPS